MAPGSLNELIQFFIQQILLSINYIPGTILSIGDAMVNKPHKITAFIVTILKQNRKILYIAELKYKREKTIKQKTKRLKI